jgi:hypothetical protein
MQEWVIKAIYATVARRIAGGAPRSVSVGAALGGLLGSATGMTVMGGAIAPVPRISAEIARFSARGGLQFR